MMTENYFSTRCGNICYWTDKIADSRITLVFLPGLTADHRLFEKQLEYFKGRYSLFVWDAPGHASSWPFSFDFDLEDKAKWLKEILDSENLHNPVIIGQSMGGYVGQMFAQLYPDSMKGFVSIDSAPLQRKYVTAAEIRMLKVMEPVYYYWPWKSLLSLGTKGVAVTDYGRQLMHSIMMTYDGDKRRYAKLSGHGMWMLADAMEKDLPYELKCPALLICGRQDHAGSCIRYNKAWHRSTGIPIEWIDKAGHNSNTDRPETVNGIIEKFIGEIRQSSGASF